MKKNLPLIIAISLPIVLFLVLAFIIIIPSLSIKTDYNFIFSLKEHRYPTLYKYDYVLKNNKIEMVLNPIEDVYDPTQEAPVLYLFDLKTGDAKEISLEEANSRMLIAGPTSPDGYVADLSYDRDYNLLNDVFDVGSDERFFFLEKDQTRKKIKTPFDRNYYDNFSFIAWTK